MSMNDLYRGRESMNPTLVLKIDAASEPDTDTSVFQKDRKTKKEGKKFTLQQSQTQTRVCFKKTKRQKDKKSKRVTLHRSQTQTRVCFKMGFSTTAAASKLMSTEIYVSLSRHKIGSVISRNPPTIHSPILVCLAELRELQRTWAN